MNANECGRREINRFLKEYCVLRTIVEQNSYTNKIYIDQIIILLKERIYWVKIKVGMNFI